ncbi:MAG: hypothetical protein NTW62_01020 [Candidatus Nomurabacteria bacterium]|nr:hypothetical protein [Candidatus Nomurabacteria bacterium]
MDKKSNGALIGSVVIIIILIIGGIYLYNTNVQQKMEQPVNTNVGATVQQNKTSADLTNLETDLNSTDLNSIDSKI